MTDLRSGLYEAIVDTALDGRLQQIDAELTRLRSLRPADASDRIAFHVAAEVKRALETVPEADRVAVGIEVARSVIAQIAAGVPRSAAGDAAPLLPGRSLHAVGAYAPDGSVRFPDEPMIPLLDTTLLTNAPGEPRVGHQLLTEVESADAIDIVMAFVRLSGVRPLQAALQRHCADGKPLRVLTTTYTGSTEAKALDMLADLGAQIRVSYDETTTRLHAKAWIFRRHSAFHTAYVGSSNLTHSAQIAGMEWNVRLSGARNPDVLGKVEAVFESYWSGGDFLPYDAEVFRATMQIARRGAGPGQLSPVHIRLEPFQERLLELIAVAREHGRHRNLLVSATGTGKTVMAAMDYVHLRQTLPRARLLFIAHREEILDQSGATFRQALQDPVFGEKWVGGERPVRFDHVFASVQSLAAAGLDHLAADHFDVVVIDEFHHAAAPSYSQVLDHLTPVELLGLTATPERTDGMSILHWFDNRIAAELRLWDAIEQHRLTPFAYYGIHDGTDLRDIPWRRGQGYDTAELTNVYTSTDAWARLVITRVGEYVDDIRTMRCLAFCVSVAHARFMAEQFRSRGIPAVAVSAETPGDERRAALRDLADSRLQVVFSVDLFNEGVDVPLVDVVLLLRPTESATLFLQQLGRGLRTAPGKTVCTVLDFVGNHRKEFRFDLRLRALLGGTRRELTAAVEQGFPFLPAGCHLELDRVAQDIVLRSIRDALPSTRAAKVRELKSLAAARGQVTLAEYLHETGLELTDVYTGSYGWSDLKEEAHLPVAPRGVEEVALRRGIARLRHIDDDERIRAYRGLLDNPTPPDVGTMTDLERRLARMLVATSESSVLKKEPLQFGVDLLWAHPQVRSELAELLDVLATRVDHLHHPAQAGVPLQVHARYTRIEILAAAGEGTGAATPPWREGALNSSALGADLFAFTLDKSGGGFSPTTRYRDYAISRDLVHWESQSTTRAGSPTGQRYIHHVERGRSILLFARARTEDASFWFLGPATYVQHEGERPIAFTWRLETPLPGDLFAAFAAAVA